MGVVCIKRACTVHVQHQNMERKQIGNLCLGWGPDFRIMELNESARRLPAPSYMKAAGPLFKALGFGLDR